MVIAIITGFFLAAGFFFFLSGTVGFLRFPDLYSRMHATGKGDTLGLLLCVAGLALYNIVVDCTWLGLVQSVKIASIAVFWFVASPTATHALLRSAFESGVRPWTKDGRRLMEKGGNKTE
ncbi:MAG: sodium:proton antiporter [Deltaproteobacteria bacterium]|jgi:multicomponent Na+:H+ antiporter subunit G|nr:sodium:proton antiporter [Deltaproteobacteria bacterium]